MDERSCPPERSQPQTHASAALPLRHGVSPGVDVAHAIPRQLPSPDRDAFTLDAYDFQIRARQPLLLPPYKGATLRGGFGHAFRRIACAMRHKTCPECLLRGHCVYSYVFETPVPAGATVIPAQTQAPRPYILKPPLETRRAYEPGETLSFGLVLVGRAAAYLPYFIYAFEELGNLGIGRGKGTFELVEVRHKGVGGGADVGDMVYQGGQPAMAPTGAATVWRDMPGPAVRSDTLRLRLLSPTRLVHQGRMVMEGLPFGVFMRGLVRRITLLSYFHCGRLHEVPDWPAFTDRAEAMDSVAEDLRWYDWERYSNRQQARINMGGLLGEVVYQGDFTPFWPYLALGEQVHVGKGGSFGLGRYEIVQ